MIVVYADFGFLTYLRAKYTFVIPIARKWQLNTICKNEKSLKCPIRCSLGVQWLTAQVVFFLFKEKKCYFICAPAALYAPVLVSITNFPFVSILHTFLELFSSAVTLCTAVALALSASICAVICSAVMALFCMRRLANLNGASLSPQFRAWLPPRQMYFISQSLSP